MLHCKSSHKLCNERLAPPILPTRLLDLGDTNNSIRLIETTAGNLTATAYICLSHCWGNEVPLRTTTQTLPSHLLSIPWERIPRTFKDAICYARLLRFRYIWIDSLWIVQDDPKDWATESAQMGRIYSQSALTIGAVSAPNASAGMFVSDKKPPTKMSQVFGRRPPLLAMEHVKPNQKLTRNTPQGQPSPGCPISITSSQRWTAREVARVSIIL